MAELFIFKLIIFSNFWVCLVNFFKKWTNIRANVILEITLPILFAFSPFVYYVSFLYSEFCRLSMHKLA